MTGVQTCALPICCAGDYTEGYLFQLLSLVEKELAIGQWGWKSSWEVCKVGKEDQSTRTGLQISWNMVQTGFSFPFHFLCYPDCCCLAHQNRQTGSAKHLDTIIKVLKIEKVINERAGTHNLNDSDFDNTGEVELLEALMLMTPHCTLLLYIPTTLKFPNHITCMQVPPPSS